MATLGRNVDLVPAASRPLVPSPWSWHRVPSPVLLACGLIPGWEVKWLKVLAISQPQRQGRITLNLFLGSAPHSLVVMGRNACGPRSSSHGGDMILIRCGLQAIYAASGWTMEDGMLKLYFPSSASPFSLPSIWSLIFSCSLNAAQKSPRNGSELD